MRRIIAITATFVAFLCLVVGGFGLVYYQNWQSHKEMRSEMLRVQIQEIVAAHPNANRKFLEECREETSDIEVEVERLRMRIQSTSDQSERAALQEEFDTLRVKLADLEAQSAKVEKRLDQISKLEASLEALEESRWLGL